MQYITNEGYVDYTIIVKKSDIKDLYWDIPLDVPCIVINNIYIEIEHRGQGFGKGLLKHVLSISKGMPVYLEVDLQSDTTLDLTSWYKSFGFEDTKKTSMYNNPIFIKRS